MSKAAIYTRISRDHAGEGLGVERQLQDCKQLAERLGAEVVNVRTDNDLSAFSGAHRPGYDALLADIENGTIDTVIAWSHDRLHRRPIELERYINLCGPRSVATHTCKAGVLDLSTPSGQAIARTLGAWANYETQTSAARVKAAKAQQARMGRPSGGQRVFGYEPDLVTVRESEAATLHEMASKVSDGWSFNRVAMDLNSRGITTGHGFEWNALKVRNVLINKRYIGIRVHQGSEYPAVWPAIFTTSEWDNLQATIIMSRTRNWRERGPFRKYLLNGYVFCGACGMKLVSSLKQYRDGSYVPTWTCKKTRPNSEPGCGKVARIMAPVDDLIADAIVYRLDSPVLRAELARQADNSVLADLIGQERAQETLLDELLEDRATGLLSRTDYARAKERAESHLTGIRTRMAAETTSQSISLPSSLTREQWDVLPLETRRQVLEVLIERVTILPSTGERGRYKQWQFNPDLVTIAWRG